MSKRIEENLHKSICTYLKTQYKNVIFNTDSSGIKLTIGQAVKLKKLRSGNGFPDIAIYEPRNKFYGLFLEVKKESPYRKDGFLYSNEHLNEQAEMHGNLRLRNYKVNFVWTFEMAKQIIDEYLKN